MFAQILERKFFDQFLNEETCVAATNDLVELGSNALPLLKLLFEGEAKNLYGIPYRELGMPLSCGLIVAKNLGSAAKPLEKYLVIELENEHPYAAPALAAIEELSEEAVYALCHALTRNILIAAEAVVALKKCNALHHPAVLETIKSSKVAEKLVLKYGEMPNKRLWCQ